MTQTIFEPDEVEGWRGEIRDSEVVRSHDEVLEDERARFAGEEDDYSDDDYAADDYADQNPADEEAEYAEEDYERESQPS